VSDDNVADINAHVDLNLDTVETEKRRPFYFSMTGKDGQVRRIKMGNPHDIDWKTILEMERPIELLREVLSDDDRDFLRNNPIKAEKFNILMENFFKHYGFNLAQGKAAASSIL
jgi:hypothetical protein